MRRLALALLAASSLTSAAQALDPAKTPPITARQVDTNMLTLHGSGSTGAIDGMSVILPDAGAIARSIQGKLRDQVDIEDFGAKCDGSSDDAVPIRNAVAAVQARGRGGEVRFPSRACIVGSTIEILTSNIQLVGKARQSTALIPSFASGDVIRIGNASTIVNNVAIRDMQIASGIVRTSGAMVNVAGASRVVLTNLTITKGYDGIAVDNYSTTNGQFGLWVSNVIVENGVNENLSIGKSSSLFANGIFVTDSFFGQGATGIALYSASGAYFKGVEVYQASSRGIALIPSTTNLGIQGVWFSTTLADSTNGDGWYFGGTGRIGEVKLNDCQASSSNGHGLETAAGVNLSSLRITNFQSTFNTSYGVFLGGGDQVQILGGEFYQNSRGSASAGGIAVANNVSAFKIIGASLGYGGWAKVNNLTPTQAYGVYVVGPNNNNYTIRENHLMGNLTSGLVDGGTGTNKSVGDNLTY